MFKQQPVLHTKLRPAHDDLSFQLELNDGDGLMHLRVQT